MIDVYKLRQLLSILLEHIHVHNDDNYAGYCRVKLVYVNALRMIYNYGGRGDFPQRM